jgi:hypothetical protein
MDQKLSAGSKFQKRLLIILASAILWIYVGNIINFHQHRIWGMQLLPVAVTTCRSKEKLLDSNNPVHSVHLLKAFDQATVPVASLFTGMTDWFVISVSYSHDPLPISGNIFTIISLRAPPVA